MKRRGEIRIGTAGWVVPKEASHSFVKEGSHLERYAQTLSCVEINSSFYRHHKGSSYRKWAASTPDDFLFSVKLSKLFTHERRLENPDADLSEAMSGILELGDKLGCVLVQLPPSLAFSEKIANSFFKSLRKDWKGAVALEPRHESWMSKKSVALLNKHDLCYVISDPGLAQPSGVDSSFEYYRLHGTPVRYRSRYTLEALQSYAAEMSAITKSGRNTWCIFDNTMFAHATTNALELQKVLRTFW